MYRAADLKEGLLHLWGWRQNENVSDFVIADSLLESETGQYFQDIHPLLTLNNLKAIAPDYENTSYPDWENTTQYREGDRVTYWEKSYRALEDNIGSQPNTNPNDWERFDSFSLWLEEKTEAAIMQAIRTFWDLKMVAKRAKNVLESKTLFDGAGRIADTITNENKLVGFEIVPVRAKGVTVKINRIGLQFTEAGNVTMYLMHSSRSEPVQEITFTRTREGGQQWFTPTTDIYLPYLSDDNDAGGSWYLVYKQSDLGTSQAINKTKDWSKEPCASCNPSELNSWKVWSQYLEIHPFNVPEESGALELWDIEDNRYDYNKNYGINLQVTVECDVTDIILEQKLAFQNVIGLQVAVGMLREMAFNPSFRIDRTNENLSKADILYELDGDSRSVRPGGIVYRLNQAFKALDLDTTQMSEICFPCSNKGIRYRTV